jgi:hypothetical protein
MERRWPSGMPAWGLLGFHPPLPSRQPEEIWDMAAIVFWFSALAWPVQFARPGVALLVEIARP